MAIEIKVPDLGDGIESGDVLSVLVAEGDTIQQEQGIVELETDKAVAEVPSTHAGRVTKVHVQSGDTVTIGTALVTLEPAEAPAAAKKSPPTKPAPAKSQPAPAAPAPTTAESLPTRTASAPVVAKPLAASAPAAPTPGRSNGSAAPASPAVRRFARELGVDLADVTGSGTGGRITKEDVRAAVRETNRSAASAAAEPATTSTETGGAESASASAPAGEPSTDAWGPVILQRVSRIRATIAANMVQSKQTAPHVTNFDDADITELESIRQSNKADYAVSGIKLTTMPFVIKAVAEALERHPVINASLDLENNQIIYKQYVHVGIAVDTPRGLMVPVIRDAGTLAIPHIARALAGLAEKARTSKITIDEMRGGTFTISNLGAIGGTYSTPVINVPEAAILLIGRAREMPVVVDGAIKIRLMMPLSLSYDHRLVDGAAAAHFLNDVNQYLQTPGRLLLAP